MSQTLFLSLRMHAMSYQSDALYTTFRAEDFLIDEMNVDIKAIAMIDLKTKNHLIPVSSEKYTLFAYGDVQICLKEKKPIMKFVEI